MKVFTAALLAALATLAVAQEDYTKRYGERNSRRDSNSDLEPPRPAEFTYISSSSEPKRSSRDSVSATSERTRSKTEPSYFPTEHYLANFKAEPTTRRENKRQPPTEGKVQHFSEAKNVPEPKTTHQTASTNKELKSEADDGIKCVKIDKKPITADDVFKGRFKREVMTCYKCEDLKKGGTYEKCSYGTDPKNKAYFVTHQKSYNSKDKPKYYKYGSDPEESKTVEREFSHGPSADYLISASTIGRDHKYDEPSSYSSSDHKYSPDSSYEKPSSGQSSHRSSDYAPKSSEYSFSTSKVDPTKSYSRHTTDAPVSYSYRTSNKDESPKESHSEGDKYSPKSSEYSFSTSKVEPTKSYSYQSTDSPVSYSYRTGKDESSKYGSGSSNHPDDKYSLKPTEYSYSTSKIEPSQSYSYETTDKPISYSYSSQKDDKPKYNSDSYDDKYSPKSSEYSYSKSIDDPLKTYHQSSSYGNDDKSSQNKNDDKYSPSEYSYSQSSSEPSNAYQQPSNYGGDDANAAQHAPQVREYSSSSSHSIPDTYVAQPSDELKKALGEFHQKDRTNCKKVQKEKMTCWKCVDKTGSQQEECMYVASSDPKAHQTAYSDVKEYQQNPQQQRAINTAQPASDSHIEKSDVKQLVTNPRQARRRSPGTTPEPVTSSVGARVSASSREAKAGGGEGARSARRGEERGRESSEGRRRGTGTRTTSQRAPSQQQSKKPHPTRQTLKPEEFEVEGPEGAFSAETRERFDPVLGVSIPEYMLTRSTHEELFDQAVRSGR